VPGKNQTNQRGELIAILKTLIDIPKGDPLKIKTDSTYAAAGMIEGLQKWEDKAWLDIDNADIFKNKVRTNYKRRNNNPRMGKRTHRNKRK
jgi:ribonuclease HI